MQIVLFPILPLLGKVAFCEKPYSAFFLVVGLYNGLVQLQHSFQEFHHLILQDFCPKRILTIQLRVGRKSLLHEASQRVFRMHGVGHSALVQIEVEGFVVFLEFLFDVHGKCYKSCWAFCALIFISSRRFSQRESCFLDSFRSSSARKRLSDL